MIVFGVIYPGRKTNGRKPEISSQGFKGSSCGGRDKNGVLEYKVIIDTGHIPKDIELLLKDSMILLWILTLLNAN